MKSNFYLLALVYALLCLPYCGTVQGQAPQPYSLKDLNEQMVLSAAWTYTAAEMRAICYQTFHCARLLFEQDLAQHPQTAKRRAVIVDIDETVLDNRQYQKGMIGHDYGYTPRTFEQWCEKRQASAMPGAVAFLKYVVQHGGDVYYISNRRQGVLQATIDNLKALGFPQAQGDHVLLRTNTSDKEPRRAQIRRTHRIVLLLGDNLNDFSSLFRGKDVATRLQLVEKLKSQFGTHFLLLPNPLYGDWEGALYHHNWGLSPWEKNQARKKALGLPVAAPVRPSPKR